MSYVRRLGWILLTVFPVVAFAQTPEHSSQTIKLPANVSSFGASAAAGRAAAVSVDKKLTVWDLASGKLLRTLPLETAEIDATVVSPDGRMIFICDHSGNSVVWEVESGRSVLQLKLSRYSSAAVFSPDGKLLAIAPAGWPLQVFEVGSFRKLTETPMVPGGVESAAFSPDSKLLATADADTAVRVYEARTGKLVSENHDFLMEPLAVAFTADSKQVIAAGGDRVTSFIDTVTGNTIHSLAKTDHPVFFSGLSVSPNGNQMAVLFMIAENMMQPAPVVTWDISSGQKRSEWLPPSIAYGMDWTHDGHLLTFGMQAADTLVFWQDR